MSGRQTPRPAAHCPRDIAPRVNSRLQHDIDPRAKPRFLLAKPVTG